MKGKMDFLKLPETDETIPTIICANMPHMACLFLLDTSEAMSIDIIKSLNAGINGFKEAVCRDKITSNGLDVAIVEFNSNVRIVQDWCPVEYMKSVNLIANGGTDIESGLRQAIDMVRERMHFYWEVIGADTYKPWIIMITAGNTKISMDGMGTEIADLDEKGKLNFMTLAVENADTSVLRELCRDKRIFKLKGYDLSVFFSWVHSIINSAFLPPYFPPKSVLPDNVDMVVND